MVVPSCLWPGCPVRLPYVLGQRFMFERDYAIWGRMLVLAWLRDRERLPDLVVTCSRCEAISLVDVEDMTAAQREELQCASTCLLCGSDTCLGCLSERHAGRSCTDVIRARQRSERGTVLTRLWLWLFTRPCPHCGSVTRRDGGCRHMQCNQCRREWCWACGQDFHAVKTLWCWNGVDTPLHSMIIGSAVVALYTVMAHALLAVLIDASPAVGAVFWRVFHPIVSPLAGVFARVSSLGARLVPGWVGPVVRPVYSVLSFVLRMLTAPSRALMHLTRIVTRTQLRGLELLGRVLLSPYFVVRFFFRSVAEAATRLADTAP